MKKATKKTANKKVVKKKSTPKKTKVKAVATKVTRPVFKFEPVPHPKFTDLVIFTKAPSWAKDIIGKRYLNSDYATKMITTLTAERTIKGGERSVTKEVKSLVGEEIISTEVEATTVSDYEYEE
jgi:hypothetical protein